MLVGCLEEIAFNKKYIDEKQLIQSIEFFKNSKYGDYLKSLIN